MAGPVTSPRWFRCLMGTKARRQLLETKSSPDTFSLMLAASGGPRWVGLVGIDRALRGFLKKRTTPQPFPLLGASSGAWRMAAISCDDNGETYEHLLEEYIGQRYEGSPTAREISQVCRSYIDRVFTPERADFALNNKGLQLNFTTAVMRREKPSRKRTALSVGLAFSLNAIARKHLAKCYTRGLFSVLPHPENSPLDGGWDDLPTTQIALTQNNFQRGLMASGSIPLVLEGESSIEGGPRGHHLDGGLVDYHFELESPQAPILYPHFATDPIPGWMDRFPPKRRVSARGREQLCIVLPSEELLAKFPTGDFPCRHDFRRFSNDQRIKLWTQTARLTNKLEKELSVCLESGDLVNIADRL